MFLEFHASVLGRPWIYCFTNFGALGRFEVPFWRPLDFEGSQIDHFRTNYQKMKTRKSARKNDGKLMRKGGALIHKKEVFELLLLELTGLAGREV